MSNLTAKQMAFVDEYLIDLNATQAAIRAGYSKNTAKEVGYENLTKPHIQEALSERKRERSKNTKIGPEYVLNALVEQHQMDVADILDDNGSVLAVREWPRIWRQNISAIDVAELSQAGNDQEKLQTIIKKIKWPDKTKVLEILGKHVDVQAFKDKIEQSTTLTLAETMADISKRNAENRKSLLPKDNIDFEALGIDVDE